MPVLCRAILRSDRAAAVVLLALMLGLAQPLCAGHLTPTANLNPGPAPETPTPSADDFTDADFATADQPELGNRPGAATGVVILLILAGIVLLVLLWFFIVYLFVIVFQGGC